MFRSLFLPSTKKFIYTNLSKQKKICWITFNANTTSNNNNADNRYLNRQHFSSTSNETFAGVHHSPITERLWRKRAASKKIETISEEELVSLQLPEILTKTPSESRIKMRYAFKTAPTLKDQYANAWGYIRVGRVLEDLDALAGNVAFHHCKDDNPNTLFPSLVTASVDNMKMLNRFTMDDDIDLVGSVAWTGRSSMIINLVLSTADCNTRLIDANFTFVARNPVTGKSMEINRIQAETDEEKQLYDRFDALDRDRKALRNISEDPEVTRKRKEEVEELKQQAHIMQDMPALADGNIMPMYRTRTENTTLMHPQHRNMNNKIFGGFLMRRAFEAAFSTCYLFGGSRPHFLELEKVTFKRPVDIGNLVKFISHVSYSSNNDGGQGEHAIVHVETEAFVVNPENCTSYLSNVFHFTFALNLHLEPLNKKLKTVLPLNTNEAEKYITGRKMVQDNL
jgi:acyl-coenzyme A thioesterase 9